MVKLRVLLCLAVSAFSLESASAARVLERGLGARPPTPAEQAYIDAAYTRVSSIAPNSLSRARVQAEVDAARLRGKAVPAAPALPAAVDNSTLPYFPPIRSQGSQGSCTAWASCYYYDTYTQAFDEGYTVSGGDNNHILSPGFMYNLINGGEDWGASTAFAVARLNEIGCSSWALKPYSAGDWTSWPSEAAWVNALNNRTQTAHFVDASTSSGLTAAKQHLANGNLAVTDFPVYSVWYDSYPANTTGINNSVYYAPAGEMVGGHAVALVGYDDSKSYVDHRDALTHYGAFLAANSWGEWWGVTNSGGSGAKGFFWVAYSMFAEGDFGPAVYYNDDRPDYRPKLYAVVGLNHPERWDIRLRGSIGGPMGWHSHDVIYYDGGALPLSDANRIAVDLTDGVSYLGSGDPVSVDVYDWSGSSYSATITSADFFADLGLTGSYMQHSSADPPLRLDPGSWGYADVTLGHSFAVEANEPDPSTVASRGVAALSATYSDNQGHGVASWEWSDGGAGGLFAPSRYVQNPSYTAPANDGYQDLTVTLTVTAICNGGEEALLSSDSATLTVLASRVRFEDIGTIANLPSTIGAAWGDYDDDGYPDLYVGGLWGNHRAYLLHNDGDGTFTDVTVAMGIRTASSDWEDWGPAWGDFNNDGLLDLVVAGGNHPLFLYRNDGTTFTEVGGAAAGMPYFPTSRGVAWGDYDGDNWLDLYVCYEESNVSRLYQNNRDGTFTEVTSAAGMDLAPASIAQDCAWADYNNDGLLDLIVSRHQQATGDQQVPRLYRNDGDGTFTDMSVAAGLPASSMEGVAWGDYDNDGWLDVYIGGNQNRSTLLCYNNGDGTFTNVYDGVVDAGANTLGVAWADYDNDGFLDVAQGNGVLPQYNESGPSNPFLYHNNGDGTFHQTAASEGVTAQRRYRTVSWADFNLDGHTDLFMAGEDGYSCLYENAGPPTDGNWLRLQALTSGTGDATDGSPVRDALGARVDVNLDNDATFPPYRTLARTIDGGSSFMGQNEQIAQFGLGSAETVAVRVTFPDGSIVVQTDVAANQQITIADVESDFGAVAGVVTELVSGDPVANAVVSCDGLCAISDYDGSYTIARVPTGSSRVVLARASNYELRTITGISVTAETMTTVDIGVCPLGFGALGGTVTDAATSDPIPGATVSCGTPNTTGADGTYLFYVPAGEGYTVAAGAPGYATQRLTNVDIPAGQLVQLDFALELMDFGSIGGTVTNARTAQAISGARVRAGYISDPDTRIEVCYETTTAANGTYLFGSVPAVAGYTVTASASGYYNRSFSGVTVLADAVTDVDIGLTAEFADVPQGFWAFEQVGACVAAGIVAGYDDGSYQPGNAVTRDQMAAYISRALAGGDDKVPAFTGTPSFPDVPGGHWALRYVQYAVAHEVVGGYDDGYYHPEYQVDRGQMAVFIARAMAGGDSNVPAHTGTPSFPDVPSTFWAYKYVQYIADDKRNVTQGYTDGLYHPETVVSRDQMAVYVARAFGL
jgi:hypothetical protein